MKMLRKVFNCSPTALSVEIAKAQNAGDPYAHHWISQLNGTHKCHKCGEVALNPRDLTLTKCMFHTHLSQAN